MKASTLALLSGVFATMAGPVLAQDLKNIVVESPAGARDYMDRVVDWRSKAEVVKLDEVGDTRIYGGRPAQDGAWPAQVSLMAVQALSQDPQSRIKAH
ncbi:MAG: hypothetical protein AAFU56_07515, partial [Pseudomonadota bacterium]